MTKHSPLRLDQDHHIPLAEASAMVHTYQSCSETSDPKATVFGKKAFHRILAQPGCEGIRIYRAHRKEGKETLVMVGVDKDGTDIVGPHAELSEWGHECPPFCDGTRLPLR